jgi:hypothetical protein
MLSTLLIAVAALSLAVLVAAQIDAPRAERAINLF